MARLYTKKVWLNDQTKLSAKNLNHIEKGVEAVADAIDEIETQGNVHTHNNKSILDATTSFIFLFFWLFFDNIKTK